MKRSIFVLVPILVVLFCPDLLAQIFKLPEIDYSKVVKSDTDKEKEDVDESSKKVIEDSSLSIRAFGCEDKSCSLVFDKDTINYLATTAAVGRDGFVLRILSSDDSSRKFEITAPGSEPISVIQKSLAMCTAMIKIGQAEKMNVYYSKDNDDISVTCNPGLTELPDAREMFDEVYKKFYRGKEKEGEQKPKKKVLYRIP